MKLDHKEKGPLTRQSQTDHMKILFIESIPQNSRYGIDSFCGTVIAFREYLREAVTPKPGQHLIHIPTGRPVMVTKVDADTITMVTLDDTWPHPKTGKPWGGSTWVREHRSMGEFKEAVPGGT